MPRKYKIIRKRKKIKVRRSRTERSFIPIYAAWKENIAELAYGQYVPGWSREDVESWMGYCLWVAHRKWKPDKGDFGKFFWSIWLNQRAYHIRHRNAAKRSGIEIPSSVAWIIDSDDDEAVNQFSPIEFPTYLIDVYNPEVPGTIQHKAWCLMALGYTSREVRTLLHIHWRKWYAMLESWKQETVRYWLKEFE